jgi:transposase
MRESFQRLLEVYDFLTEQIAKQTQLLRELSQTPHYRERFRRAEQLAAYVGLTPSQYSSAEKIRMGRITGAGKNGLRAILVEASWKLITKDGAMRDKYERIKARSGAKRAIVAIARTLLLRSRRILLDDCPYGLEVIGSV